MGKRTWLDKDLRDRWILMLAQLPDNPECHRLAQSVCSQMRSGWAANIAFLLLTND
jgi:hypothetical protein